MGCFIAMLVYFGAFSYFKIGLDTVPKMDVPYVQIVTVYPGASPEEIETDVAKHIEDAVASLDGLKHVTSTCMDPPGSGSMGMKGLRPHVVGGQIVLSNIKERKSNVKITHNECFFS